MFSKTCQYGLRATIFVAEQSIESNKVGLKEIALAIGSPEAFTAKVLQKLTKKKIITSIKGPYGGFVIEGERLKQISLNRIVNIFDGEDIYTACGLGLSHCNEEAPCPLHFKFVEVRDGLNNLLKNNTLHDVLYTKGLKNRIWLRR